MCLLLQLQRKSHPSVGEFYILFCMFNKLKPAAECAAATAVKAAREMRKLHVTHILKVTAELPVGMRWHQGGHKNYFWL